MTSLLQIAKIKNPKLYHSYKNKQLPLLTKKMDEKMALLAKLRIQWVEEKDTDKKLLIEKEANQIKEQLKFIKQDLAEFEDEPLFES